MALDGKEALKETEAWSNLQTYFNENKNTIDMKKMFDEDSRRFDKNFGCLEFLFDSQRFDEIFVNV